MVEVDGLGIPRLTLRVHHDLIAMEKRKRKQAKTKVNPDGSVVPRRWYEEWAESEGIRRVSVPIDPRVFPFEFFFVRLGAWFSPDVKRAMGGYMRVRGRAQVSSTCGPSPPSGGGLQVQQGVLPESHVRIAWGKDGHIEEIQTDGEGEGLNWSESVVVYGIVGIMNLFTGDLHLLKLV